MRPAAHQQLVDASASASQAAIEAATAAAAAAVAAGIPLAATIQRFLVEQQTAGLQAAAGTQFDMNMASHAMFSGINGAPIDTAAAFGTIGGGIGIPGAAGAIMTSSFPGVNQQGSLPASQSPSTMGHTVTV